MINFDFNTMVDRFVDKEKISSLVSRREDVYKQFQEAYMSGWRFRISDEEVDRIIRLAKEVKNHSKCLVVIGIGGSFLGSRAVKEMLGGYFDNNSFPVIYVGTTLSSKYMNELLNYLEGVDFSINVISKSGNTMETTITYRLIRELMEKKYHKDDLIRRIIITTDKEKGVLREEVNRFGYNSFVIPDNIGGRYSIMTAAHLFPLAFNIDISKFIEGYYDGEKYKDEAFLYAITRKCLYNSGKFIENYVISEENMYYFAEWLKQLYGESEGKNGKGIFPVSTVYTRDLHSLGQFIQEGNKIIFETFLKVGNSDKIIYDGMNLHSINNYVLDSVRKAHYSGNVASVQIMLDEINEFNVGSLMYFFMLGAAFSGFLFDVDPYNQPGVEVYKRVVREDLGVF